jgi:hypothetical protein
MFEEHQPRFEAAELTEHMLVPQGLFAALGRDER